MIIKTIGKSTFFKKVCIKAVIKVTFELTCPIQQPKQRMKKSKDDKMSKPLTHDKSLKMICSNK